VGRLAEFLPGGDGSHQGSGHAYIYPLPGGLMLGQL